MSVVPFRQRRLAFAEPSDDQCLVLHGADRDQAIELICEHHYTRSVPSGKSHYLRFEDAFIVWSIPANNNIGTFLFSAQLVVWELSRLWAPDGHAPNLLTRAISASIRVIRRLENPDALVSYADPNVGHRGGVYRAASWVFHGQSDETRCYVGHDGRTVARRGFHSGIKGLTKQAIEASGYKERRSHGKLRFVKPLTRNAKRSLVVGGAACGGEQ